MTPCVFSPDRPLTLSELEREWDYRYHERMGMLCPPGSLETQAQRDLAAREADEAVEALKAAEESLPTPGRFNR